MTEKTDSVLLEIVNLCATLDQRACGIYSRIADEVFAGTQGAEFWRSVSQDEAKHFNFWERVQEFAKEGALPAIFSNPFEVRDDLQSVLSRVYRLEERIKDIKTLSQAIMLAYTLELHLLHPAFETFFHFMKGPLNDETPEKEYASHLEKFFHYAKHSDIAAPEVEIFEGILDRLLKMNKELVIYSQVDPLTAIFNRRGFFNTAGILAMLAKRNESAVGVMLVDLDHFKQINDRHGHQTGDEVLKSVASILQSNIRHSDVLGRYGGEEFIIFLSSMDPEKIREIGEKVRKSVETGNNPVPITVSIGCSRGYIQGNVIEELETLIRRADEYLYQSKNAGRNRVTCGH
ncbi:MAG: GGDEF domain-containing protein [Nitrospinae bacterium]|nr:GGDEF domain-containing protein [Nitrospinota bacterium]